MKPKYWSSPLGVLFACVACHAAVTLQFAKPGKYSVSLYEDSAVRLSLPAENVKSLSLTDASKALTGKGKPTVRVIDQSTGNSAMAPLPPEGTIVIKPESFKFISEVMIRVADAKGGIPDTAIATLRDGAGMEQSVQLSARDEGAAVFRYVASGDGAVTVQQGALTNRQTISLRLPLKRETPVLELPAVVTLPDGMKTIAPSQSKTTTQPQTTRPPSLRTGGFLTGFIGFLIALLAFGFVGLYVARSLRNKGVTVQSALAAAGVQLPDDSEPIPVVTAEPPKPVDPTICPFCGARKDPNAPCANCAVAPGAPVSASVAPAPGGVPRLVCVAGPKAASTFNLVGTMSIGRDPSRDISIPDDASLSRHHASVETVGSSVTMVDNGSSNGTWVNGRKVDRQMLRGGDEIVMGASRFRFEA
ncbi:MAG TPA: FHA domain-containing protein [Armatimonadota bacterium]|jgi:hypothetical protein